jgi:hypothetical protein
LPYPGYGTLLPLFHSSILTALHLSQTDQKNKAKAKLVAEEMLHSGFQAVTIKANP